MRWCLKARGQRTEVRGQRFKKTTFCFLISDFRLLTSKCRPLRSGVTLIELLLVTALFSVVAIAAYVSLSGGVRVWNRLGEVSAEEDLNVFLERFADDVRNGFEFTGLKFVGQKYFFECPTILPNEYLGEKTVGMVRYRFDRGDGIMEREVKDFNKALLERDGFLTHALGSVDSAEFEYYDFDKATKLYLWKPDWNKEGVPWAIRLKLVFNSGGQLMRYERTVNLMGTHAS